MNKIQEKRIRLDVIGELYSKAESMKEDVEYEYQIVGKEQQTRYDRETHDYVPVFDDNGDPVMIDKWENIKKSKDRLDEEDELKIKVLNEILTALDKLF